MDINVGDVFRLGDWPFADAVVTSVDGDMISLYRPWASALRYARYPMLAAEPITQVHKSKFDGGTWKRVDTERIRE